MDGLSSGDSQRSGALDVGSLLALGALHNFEGNLFAFFQGLEAIHVDRGEMGEQILAAIIRSNEAKTLGIIEPFHSTDCHVWKTFLQKTNKFPGLPDSLFAPSDPVHAATLMQPEAKHGYFYAS
jgi:hypothetical protein